jgi:DNA-binding LytR/AlgR family response regulator
MTTYVIDDEPTGVEILKTYIQQTPSLQLMGSSTNSVEALLSIQKNPVDIVFLDIHMPTLSGIDFLNVMSENKKPPKIIITTAFPNYALDGFEHGVVDYLLKPISYDRFIKAVQKAALKDVPQTPHIETEDDFIFVKSDTKGKFIKINFNEIKYVEGLKNYISIYTENERIITLLSLKEVEERLAGKGFVRIHKSYIVASSQIKAVDGNQILMKDKKYVPLGDSYRTEFFKVLDQFLMKSQKN